MKIDNLDITTPAVVAGAPTMPTTQINVSLSVLDHANPSFSLSSDQNSLTYDFGTVTLGSNVPAFEFDIANSGRHRLISLPSWNLTRSLASGDARPLADGSVTFSGGKAMAAGLSDSFIAAFDTSAEGSFSAIYTLNFSDENLPGASNLGSLTLNLSGSVEATFVDTADFDGDGDVDGADFLIWQRGFGSRNHIGNRRCQQQRHG